MKMIPTMVKQITVMPPITPPIIAPRFTDFCLEDVDIGLNIAGTCKELVADTADDVWAAEMPSEMVGKEVETDGVVFASAVFGNRNNVSVRASDPQAIYSND
jgi:hypothetical protein